MKTYSLLFAWSDTDKEQGEFGTTVRAANEEDAEAQGRDEMRASHIENYGEDGVEEYEHEDGTFGGRLIEISEGAIWRASDLEEALRNIVASSDANDHGSLMNAIEHGKSVIASIDKMLGEEG